MASLLLAGILVGLISNSIACDFYVGGKDGWVLNPSESFNNWAGRNRFQVNDKLVFKYKKGDDSVLLVKKEDYDSCNVSNPIQRLDGGDSVFQFDRSGHFFFISGTPGRCARGQKLVVAVLAVGNKKPVPPLTSSSPSLPPSPTPSLKPPTSSPSPSPSSSSSPPSPSSSLVPSPSPSSTPSPSPVLSPTPSPSPSSTPSPSPVLSPTPSPSPSSANSPTPSPAIRTPVSPPAPSQPSPSQQPTSGNGSSTGSLPPPSPASPPSSSPALTVSSFLIGLLTLALGNAILS